MHVRSGIFTTELGPYYGRVSNANRAFLTRKLGQRKIKVPTPDTYGIPDLNVLVLEYDMCIRRTVLKFVRKYGQNVTTAIVSALVKRIEKKDNTLLKKALLN